MVWKKEEGEGVGECERARRSLASGLKSGAAHPKGRHATLPPTTSPAGAARKGWGVCSSSRLRLVGLPRPRAARHAARVHAQTPHRAPPRAESTMGKGAAPRAQRHRDRPLCPRGMGGGARRASRETGGASRVESGGGKNNK